MGQDPAGCGVAGQEVGRSQEEQGSLGVKKGWGTRREEQSGSCGERSGEEQMETLTSEP